MNNLIEQEHNIKLYGKSLAFYRKKDPSLKYGQIITVKSSELCPNSSIIVLAICEMCGKKCKIQFIRYTNCKLGFVCSAKCNLDRTYKNNGILNFSQLESVKEKKKKTNLRKLGVENPSQSDIIKRKKEETCLINYGVNNPSKSSVIKKRKEDTLMKNFGVTVPAKSEIIIESMKKTTMDRYGVDNISKKEEIKERKKKSCFEHFGVDHPMQSDVVMNKSIDTSIKNKYKIKKFKNTDLYYASKLEYDFLCFCEKYKIEIKRGKSIKYNFNGEVKVYFPDFYWKDKNLIVEIKSTYTYFIELSKNLAKQSACINSGFNFIFIIDKKYSDLLKIMQS